MASPKFKDRLPEVIEFRRKYGRLPNQHSENKEEISLYMWIYHYKSSYPPLTNFLKENGIEIKEAKEVKEKLTREEKHHRNLLLIQEYYENNSHSLSRLRSKDEQLCSWMHHHKSSYPPLANFLKENGIEVKVKKKLTKEERKHRDYQNLLLIQKYYKKNNHSLSGLERKDKKLFNWMYYCYHKSSYPPLTNFLKENGIEIKEVKKKLTKEERKHRDYQNFLLIWEYYENNNHSLSGLYKNEKLYEWYDNHKSSYPPLIEFFDIIEEIKLGNKEAILLYNLKYSSQQ